MPHPYTPYTQEDEERSQFLDQRIAEDDALTERYNALNQPVVDLRGDEPIPDLGTASQIAGPSQGAAPSQGQEGGGGGIMDFLKGIPGSIQKSVGRAMDDPTRRAMIAFGAKMMDTSHRFGQGLTYGTQIGRALQSGLDEYAAATRTKAPKVTVRKFMKGDEQWGTYGDWQGEDWNDYNIPPHRIGAKEAGTKPAWRYFDRDNKSWKQWGVRGPNGKFDVWDPPVRVYKSEAEQKTGAKAGKEGAFEAEDEHFPEKRKQFKILEGMKQKYRIALQENRTKLDLQNFQRKKEYEKRHGLGPLSDDEWRKRQEFKSKLIEDRQNRLRKAKDKTDQLYTLPGGRKVSFGTLLSMFKITHPSQVSSKLDALIEAKATGQDLMEVLAANRPDAEAFGRWLDEIGFTDGLEFLKARSVGDGTSLEHGAYYNTKMGTLRYHGGKNRFFKREQWKDKDLWPTQ